MKEPVELEHVEAPFTDGQVDQINAYQRAGVFKALTCPDHLGQPLEASAAGLACSECSFLQKLCPEYIVSGRWRQFICQTHEQPTPAKTTPTTPVYAVLGTRRHSQAAGAERERAGARVPHNRTRKVRGPR